MKSILLVTLSIFLCSLSFAARVNYSTSGGADWVVGSGGVLHVESGGTVRVDSGGLLDVNDCLAINADDELCSADTTIATADVLTLNQVCQTILAAPGAGFANVVREVYFFYDYNSAAYAGIATIDELSIKYTSSAGAEVTRIEATGFLDQTSDQIRIASGNTYKIQLEDSAVVSTAVTPVANALLCVHMLNSEVTTGDSPLKVRVFYKTVPTTF